MAPTITSVLPSFPSVIGTPPSYPIPYGGLNASGAWNVTGTDLAGATVTVGGLSVPVTASTSTSLTMQSIVGPWDIGQVLDMVVTDTSSHSTTVTGAFINWNWAFSDQFNVDRFSNSYYTLLTGAESTDFTVSTNDLRVTGNVEWQDRSGHYLATTGSNPGDMVLSGTYMPASTSPTSVALPMNRGMRTSIVINASDLTSSSGINARVGFMDASGINGVYAAIDTSGNLSLTAVDETVDTDSFTNALSGGFSTLVGAANSFVDGHAFRLVLEFDISTATATAALYLIANTGGQYWGSQQGGSLPTTNETAWLNNGYDYNTDYGTIQQSVSAVVGSQIDGGVWNAIRSRVLYPTCAGSSGPFTIREWTYCSLSPDATATFATPASTSLHVHDLPHTLNLSLAGLPAPWNVHTAQSVEGVYLFDPENSNYYTTTWSISGTNLSVTLPNTLPADNTSPYKVLIYYTAFYNAQTAFQIASDPPSTVVTEWTYGPQGGGGGGSMYDVFTFLDRSSAGTFPIVRTRWTLSDGTVMPNLHQLVHVFPDNGTYTASLQVWDALGNTDTHTVTITVSGQTGTPSGSLVFQPSMML